MTALPRTSKSPERTDTSPALWRDVGNPLVLVVDDHADTRFLLRTVLEMRGLEVAESADGEEAVHMAERVHPVLVLMDAELPRLDGMTAMRRMREHESLNRVPVIFLSGHAQAAFRAAAFDAGCDGYLVKPFEITSLDKLLDVHLAQKM